MKLPETWVKARLGDVLRRVDTKIDPQASDSVSHFYVGLEHIESHTGKLLQESEEVTEGSDILSIKTAFRKGDILYGKLRPNLNKVYVAEQDGICSTDIWALRTTDQMLPEFALRYLRSPAIYVRAAQLATGANLPRLSANAFDRLSVPLPTLPEQQRIVDILKQAEEVRKKKIRALQLSSDISTSLFEKHFGVAGASTAWPMEPFGKHTTYSKYGPRFPDQPYSDAGIHVLRTTDMNNDGTIRWWEAPKLALTEKQIKEHALKPGALIITRSGSIGPFALFDGPEGQCVAGAYLIEFGLADSVEPEYVRALFATPYVQQMLRKAVRSVAQPNVNAPNIQAILVPMPSKERQKAFAIQIRELRAWTHEISSSVGKFDHLAHAVVGNAFSGDLTLGWREQHHTEIIKAKEVRDAFLLNLGTKLSPPSLQPRPISTRQAKTERPARLWLLQELSEFQRQVLAAFTAYPEQPVLAEDPEVFARFCDDADVLEYLEPFGSNLNNRIRRTLSQLAALGLIAKITVPKNNLDTRERDYLKAFRPLRAEEFTRLADVAALAKTLSRNEELHHFTVIADFETSEHAGAGGMFQVADLRDDNDNLCTELVDQGKHYAALDELAADIARRLGVQPEQIVLED